MILAGKAERNFPVGSTSVDAFETQSTLTGHAGDDDGDDGGNGSHGGLISEEKESHASPISKQTVNSST